MGEEDERECARDRGRDRVSAWVRGGDDETITCTQYTVMHTYTRTHNHIQDRERQVCVGSTCALSEILVCIA